MRMEKAEKRKNGLNEILVKERMIAQRQPAIAVKSSSLRNS